MATDSDFTTLEEGFGGAAVAAPAMKSSSNDTPSWNGTNASGFSGLKGGTRHLNGVFYAGSYYWTSTRYGPGPLAWLRNLYDYSAESDREETPYRFGCSVRCVED